METFIYRAFDNKKFQFVIRINLYDTIRKLGLTLISNRALLSLIRQAGLRIANFHNLLILNLILRYKRDLFKLDKELFLLAFSLLFIKFQRWLPSNITTWNTKKNKLGLSCAKLKPAWASYQLAYAGWGCLLCLTLRTKLAGAEKKLSWAGGGRGGWQSPDFQRNQGTEFLGRF